MNRTNVPAAIAAMLIAGAGMAGHARPRHVAIDGEMYDMDPKPQNTRLSQTPHIDTPKPVSKRRARRLRGKAERKAS